MSGLRNIKRHIKSVSNIKKITNSMKMVAAARFMKAEKQLSHARRMGECAKRFYEITNITKDLTKHRIVLAVTSDRGLCGSMHSRICKYIRNTFLKTSPEMNELVCLGEKSKNNFAMDHKHKICLVVNGIGHRDPTFLTASSIVQNIVKYKFLHGNIVYAKFRNLMSFEINECDIYTLPLIRSTNIMYVYETEVEDVVSYIEFSTTALIYYSLAETYATELASRISAMSSASKNAGELTKKLQLEFNRRRQSGITSELMDIVSGASCVMKRK